MKESSSIFVTIKFSFAGHVSHEDLQKAIGRALNTKQFRLVGQYTILDTSDEIMVEVPKSPPAEIPKNLAVDIPTGGAPIVQIGLKR